MAARYEPGCAVFSGKVAPGKHEKEDIFRVVRIELDKRRIGVEFPVQRLVLSTTPDLYRSGGMELVGVAARSENLIRQGLNDRIKRELAQLRPVGKQRAYAAFAITEKLTPASFARGEFGRNPVHNVLHGGPINQLPDDDHPVPFESGEDIVRRSSALYALNRHGLPPSIVAVRFPPYHFRPVEERRGRSRCRGGGKVGRDATSGRSDFAPPGRSSLPFTAERSSLNEQTLPVVRREACGRLFRFQQSRRWQSVL